MPNTNFLFHFLKYISPTWYFNLQTSAHVPYWIDFRKIETELDVKSFIDFDEAYESEESLTRDVAYQLLLKGFISEKESLALELKTEMVSLKDEYRFIKRFFNPFWAIYVLVLRIVTFHNPVREIKGFSSATRVQRVDIFKNINQMIPKGMPYAANELVSVILPTLNRYSYLKDILHDLEQQTYQNFEVIVIDQSLPFEANFYSEFKLNLNVIHQPIPGLWQARNSGVKVSKGQYMAFTEDDVRVAPDWLEQHLACIHLFNADISAGIFYAEGSKVPIEKSFFRWAEQFASGNALVKKSVFSTVGLFDLQFERMRMGDGEFGLRCYVKGLKSVSNPVAYCLDVKAPVGGLRQMGSWDGWRPKSLLAPRPIPSVFYFYRLYFGDAISGLAVFQNIVPSIIPYRFKKNKSLYALAIIFAFLLSPLLLFQVGRSWRLSGKKLTTGPLIQTL